MSFFQSTSIAQFWFINPIVAIMKTILVPTDFSPAASNAAWYGFQLAARLKANMLLCNAMMVPMEVVGTSEGMWPMEDYTSVQHDTAIQLEHEVKELMMKHKTAALTDSFCPEVSCTCELGPVNSVIRDTAEEFGISLAVMGMSGMG